MDYGVCCEWLSERRALPVEQGERIEQFLWTIVGLIFSMRKHMQN